MWLVFNSSRGIVEEILLTIASIFEYNTMSRTETTDITEEPAATSYYFIVLHQETMNWT
jgi:hypothetical protein